MKKLHEREQSGVLIGSLSLFIMRACWLFDRDVPLERRFRMVFSLNARFHQRLLGGKTCGRNRHPGDVPDRPLKCGMVHWSPGYVHRVSKGTHSKRWLPATNGPFRTL